MKTYLIKILSVTLLLLLSGCNGSSAKPAKVDRSLPQVSINGSISDMTAIAFEWKPITDPRIEAIIVYRNDPESKTPNKLSEIDAIENTHTTHYLDRKLTPDTIYYYSFALRDTKKSVSLATKKQMVKTRPRLPSVSFFTTSSPMARAVKLIWRPHTDLRVVSYRIEGRVNGQEKWKKVALIKGRLNAEYIHTGLKDNTRYEYRIKAITFDDFASQPSPTIAVLTIALPKPVNSVKATQGKAGFISVSWTDSDKTNKTHYQVYRSKSNSGRYNLVADNVKSSPYKDTISTPGKQYYYKVVGVNKENLIGSLKASQSTVGNTIDAPRGPKNLVAMVENATVQLTWKATDARTVSYIVVKETSKGFMSSETKEFKNIKKTLMIDSSLKPEESYTFYVVAVDKNGIRSAPSNSVNVQIKGKK